jgi:hypothetical protein
VVVKSIRSTRFAAVWSFAAIIAIESIAQAPLLWKGKISKEGDVTVVRNPKEPLFKNSIVTIKEELSIGGENAPPEEIFSLVKDVSVGPDGRIYIADLMQSEIRIFDKFGKFLRAFGKKGQAPEEFFQLMEMSYCPLQNEIFVHDRIRGYYFGPDGNFKRSFPYRYNFQSVKADAWGNLRGIVILRDKNSLRTELRLLDERGNLGFLLAQTPAEDINVENPYQPILTWCIRRDGSIIEGYPETYEFHIHDPNGKIVRRILKAYDPVEVTSTERELFTKSTLPSVRKRTYKFSRYHPAFIKLPSDERGWIYAGTREKARAGNLFLFDIYNQDGLYLSKEAWPGGVLIISDGKLYSREEDAGGYPVVKRYALIWKKDIY